ncbi:MAG: hypothetical protein M3141_03275 [Actinomycetota bacterium]|nr:hypothetical protein [Actinomycetota bacterium]
MPGRVQSHEPAVAEPPPAAWVRTPEEVVARTRMVPSSVRGFGVEPKLAQKVCGVGPQLLEQLLDLGLPSRKIGGQRTFDGVDLANVAVHLGLPSLQLHVIGLWGRTLEAACSGPTARYEIEYQARCAHCQKPGGSYTFFVPPGRRAVTRGGRPYRMDVERPTEWPALPAAVAPITKFLSEFWIWGLPEQLRNDLGFARETRLGGCSTAAMLVNEKGAEEGLEMRLRFGLMLVVAYASGHYWNEVRVGDEWVPYDPFLLQTLIRHTGLDPVEWPETRSPGALLAPMGDRYRELATHNGHSMPSAIETRVYSDDAAGAG